MGDGDSEAGSINFSDGRTAFVSCPECRRSDVLAVLYDVADRTVTIVCERCKRVVIVAEEQGSKLSLDFVVESIDDLDPRIRELIDYDE